MRKMLALRVSKGGRGTVGLRQAGFSRQKGVSANCGTCRCSNWSYSGWCVSISREMHGRDRAD